VEKVEVIYHCKKHGILKYSDVISFKSSDICGLCFNSQPAEIQGDGQALHTTTPAQNAEADTSGVA